MVKLRVTPWVILHAKGNISVVDCVNHEMLNDDLFSNVVYFKVNPLSYFSC